MTSNLVKERLIVFTRYPEPGKTKTRLIPALGAKGAANLQRQMTEHTMVRTREIKRLRFLSVEVYFSGGNPELMRHWLGWDITYQPQCAGDLGERMASAFQVSFAAGMTEVVIIGTDCPDLNASIMTQAFEMLKEKDLVLGPSQDGGYYLIGLRRLVPELFKGIHWSTAEVLQQTARIAQKLELAVAYLSVLNDVDCPEDLWVWNSDGFYRSSVTLGKEKSQPTDES
ncbi:MULTISPECIES: TIGR04282 family arsenosugar biosynthesis glycosyltransferase [unclassified Coleofasciculus]|uniref:TIGR04282 family arsenosugar biosynthesis glycosyltransferase n=1 Tax=unclassified Coleofasciculus TaxID=2692782 RepID=UPI00187E122E|nr:MULTISPECIES: TIGR04282 family arsenosugar biosynthesis glycosyltransferase [unclassified Coleofasciculus]MBE9128565.1 TIGR04282 family arsenosugar biosynthesis glycosyltransferase [Coleofasciculus sp. LEGE 07081]MBE9149355.1 TIGR04282 family arsenosugar biosynthesis glycosyltransferase [Coleofasciculus sp. LEGE 07092]